MTANRITLSAALIGALAALLNTASVFAQSVDPLGLVRTIPLPDVRGRIDHLTIDLPVDVCLSRVGVTDRSKGSIFVRGSGSTHIPVKREPAWGSSSFLN